MTCVAQSVSPSDPPNTIVVSVGEDAGWSVLVTDPTLVSSSNPRGLVDLTGAQGFFTVRRRPEDAVALIAKRTLNAGGSDAQFLIPAQTGANLGKAFFFADFADTVVLDPASAPLVYDVWFILTTGKHKPTVRNGVFNVDPSVTRFRRP